MPRKKDDNNKLILILLLFLFLFWWGGSHGWFSTESVTNVNNYGSSGGQQGTSGGNSGGSTTPTYTCTDRDNGIDFEVSSNCEDSFHMAGFMDTCESQLAIDYYCDSNNICQRSTRLCNFPSETCVGGVCQKMPCNQIIPTIASNCASGSCSSGTCIFVPATLTMRARCTCG